MSLSPSAWLFLIPVLVPIRALLLAFGLLMLAISVCSLPRLMILRVRRRARLPVSRIRLAGLTFSAAVTARLCGHLGLRRRGFPHIMPTMRLALIAWIRSLTRMVISPIRLIALITHIHLIMSSMRIRHHLTLPGIHAFCMAIGRQHRRRMPWHEGWHRPGRSGRRRHRSLHHRRQRRSEMRLCRNISVKGTPACSCRRWRHDIDIGDVGDIRHIGHIGHVINVIVGDVHADIYHRRSTRHNRRRGADWRRHYDPCTRSRRWWNEDTGRPNGARPGNDANSRNRHGDMDSHRRGHEAHTRFSPEAIHKNDIAITMFIIRLYPRIAGMRRCNPVTMGPHPIPMPHPVTPNPYSIFKWRRWRRFHQ